MIVQIINCEQNSPEWFEARRGIPTASQFSAILAKGEGKTRRTYMLKLAGEIITGKPMESFSNEHTERGHEIEQEARDLYCLETGATLQRVGFIKNGIAGCSPDSLIGEEGGLEIKTKLPHVLAEIILKGELPSEHRAQVQGSLWVTGRKWWDFWAYWPFMPPFHIRVERDEAYIGKLADSVAAFNLELHDTVKAIRGYGGKSTLLADLQASAGVAA